MPSDERFLDELIDRYPPAVVSTARAALRKLSAAFPGARRIAYERRGSLPIGFAPSDGGGPLFSVVLYPRWVRFFFLEGASLDDPRGRLEGTGTQVRSLVLDAVADVLDDPYVRGLLKQALRVADADLSTGQGTVIVKRQVSRPSKGSRRQ